MGKGRIVSGGTDGYYTIEVLHNRDRINAELAALEAQVNDINEERAQLEADLNEVQAELDAAILALDEKIAEWQQLLVDLEGHNRETLANTLAAFQSQIETSNNNREFALGEMNGG